MKQSWITRLALIGFSTFLVTGCYNGWSNEGQGKSSAAPDIRFFSQIFLQKFFSFVF